MNGGGRMKCNQIVYEWTNITTQEKIYLLGYRHEVYKNSPINKNYYIPDTPIACPGEIKAYYLLEDGLSLQCTECRFNYDLPKNLEETIQELEENFEKRINLKLESIE